MIKVLGQHIDGREARIAIEHSAGETNLQIRKWALRWSRMNKSLVVAGPWLIYDTHLQEKAVQGRKATVVTLAKVDRVWEQ